MRQKLIGLKPIKQLLQVGGKQTYKFLVYGVVISMIAFCADIALAIFLQRFFISTGLISGITDTRFFGEINSTRIEGVALLIISLIRSSVFWLNSSVNANAQVVFETTLRKKISIWSIYFSKKSAGQLSNLYQNLVATASAFVANLQFLGTKVIMLVATFLVLVYYSFELTLLILIVLIFLVPLQKQIDGKLNTSGTKIRDSLLKSSDHLFQISNNAFFIRTSGLVKSETQKFKLYMNDYLQSSKSYNIAASLRGILPQFIGLSYVVLVASRRGSNFLDSQGELVAFLFISIRFFQITGEVARVTATLRNSWPRIKDVVEWHTDDFGPNESWMNNALHAEEEAREKIFERIGIELENLDFGWAGEKKMFTNLSLSIKPGQWCVFYGESGRGKSTLIEIIMGEVTNFQGKVFFELDGLKHNSSSIIETIKKSTAYVGSNPYVFDGTILDNLSYGLATSWVTNHKIINGLGGEFLFELPLGLDTYISSDNAELSTGQKQRISLIRALLKNPKLLILDEATSNLDEKLELQILSFIKDTFPSLTVIAATHRSAYTDFSDVTINLDEVD